MLTVTSILVRSFDLDHLDLSWKIGQVPGPRRDEPHEIFNYEFYVLRSQDSPEGPYQQIAGPLRDQYLLRDVQVSLLHKWRQYFYKIKIVHKPTGEEKIFGPAASSLPERNLEAAEMIRLEDKLFREFTGRKCWLYIARTFGPVCACYDQTLGRMTISNHKPCFGRGTLGGYMSPIEVYVQIDPVAKAYQEGSLHSHHPEDTTGRMISFPPVSPDDVLIETENKRWRVLAVRSSERLRTPIHQELTLHRIPIGDIEYQLPVNVNVQEIIPASEKNFTNKSRLSQNGDFSDIIATYSRPRGVYK